MSKFRITKLDRYIITKFISCFFISILLMILIVIIFDISEKINDFVNNKAPLDEIVFDYYVNFIPYFINMFCPLFVFITVIFFTSRMAANSEIIAILSGGISYRRMLVPYMVSAAFIAVFSLGLNLYVIPRSNAVRIDFEAKYVKHHNNYKHQNIHYQISPGQFVYVEAFSSWNNTAYRFTLESMENNRLVSKLSAEYAQWDTSFDGWHLRNYFIRDYTEGIEDRVRTGRQLDTVINLQLVDFFRNEKTVETLSVKDLRELTRTQEMRGDANIMYSQIESNQRWTLPFSAFILTLMGVCLSSRKKRGGIGWNIATGIALSFSYILFMRFAEMFVVTGAMPALLAMWIPNILYALIAIGLYRYVPK